MAWLLTLALALAGEPVTCEEQSWPEPDEVLSVAWVSPVGQTVGRRGTVEVVPTADLKAFVAAESKDSVGRMLQRLGMRKKARDPVKRFKVVVFDVRRVDLCRPVQGYENPAALDGVASCTPKASKPDSDSSGCGYTVDRATGEPGLLEYQAEWADLARNGFCVLPAERFVQ